MHSASVFEYVGEKMEVIIACASEEYGTFGSLNLKNAKICQVHDNRDVEHLLRRLHSPADYVHVNSCLKVYPGIEQFGYALRKLLALKCIVFALNVEQFQWWGMKGLLRRMQWFYLYNFGIGRRIKAIGCTGESGVAAHHKAFISKKRLFDFIYTVPSPQSYLLKSLDFTVPIQELMKNRTGVRFIYVGQIIDRKCVLEMVKTFNRLNVSDYSLEIIGGGERTQEIKSFANQNKRIHYWGKIAPSQVRKVLSQTDVLLLPSRLEGWGCTTSEALMMGNRAIVSNAVGSSSLIKNREWAGDIFRSGDWNDLGKKILSEIKRGRRSEEERLRIINWAKCLYPELEADYLLKIIDFYTGKSDYKPKAPWA